MSVMVYDFGEWRKETKEEVMEAVDIEGKTPCDLCWEKARDNGIYAFPMKVRAEPERCRCGRILSFPLED